MSQLPGSEQVLILDDLGANQNQVQGICHPERRDNPEHEITQTLRRA
jgi:hypothetical protein